MEPTGLDQPADVHLPSFLGYNLVAVPLAWSAYQLSRWSNEKARAGLEGRRGLFDRLERQAESLRGCVWFHASSAGEYEQGRPIMRALAAELRDRDPSIRTLLTVFSPSGYAHATNHAETDVVEYLPLDTAVAAKRCMQLLQPRALVFVKFDCWPNTVWAARRAGVPLLLLDANFHRKSQRLAPGARGFFRRLFDCFQHIGAVSEGDATRFRHDLGVHCPISVTGDTRADQVVHRWQRSDDHPLARHLQATEYRYVILGSIWPSDQKVMLDATLDAVQSRDDVGLLAVPHEPTPEHLADLEAAAQAKGLVTTRLSELVELKGHAKRSTAAARDRSRWRVIVVDTVGVLAEMYRAGTVSYVGGGFSTGIHNVLEPTITAQPVLMGPRIHNAYEADCLIEQGAGFLVRTDSDMREHLTRLLDDEPARATAARRAQEYVLAQRGATQRSLDLLRPYVFSA